MNQENAVWILIVDDVETNRFALRDMMKEMGYQPILTENGEQAMKIVEKFPLSLIITDIAMPVMDGHELCALIKKNPATREIPVIFISAYDNPSDIVKGFEVGGADYITKPFIPEVVKARVEVHLKAAETGKKLQDLNRKLQHSITAQMEQNEREKKNVLYALIRVARENANYDEAHMERLSKNCRILAEALQLSPLFDSVISDSYIDMIELSAPLCDIGNVSIPSTLLQKQDALTDEEIQIMQSHTVQGARILRDIEGNGEFNNFIHMSREIANFHHENYDGSGYPTGKKGDEIPLAAQIVAVVGEFCALTETRSYRDAYSLEEALAIMDVDAEIKFNPNIYKVAKKIYRQFV
ncbi:response regulator [Agathobacter ruminis]|uniref:Stage 0 sporulation protein A homolog n=1 Tax=Agathobacter ruminis TaxID=1712665 RepID=A0A2G3E1I5_9FIRM|nr:HD domain-containing phosphohydrolase [Agathobacter ruminis]MDC7301977.1 response regulator [Agathobacter ruminis]PHU37010.1 two-component system response regulator [Agathobacter ruminis]